jgi:hypothetical protein
MLRSLNDLDRYGVSATDGELGRVVDFLLDDQRWVVRYLVVETGDFFGGGRVLISPISCRQVDRSSRRFHLALTMDKIKNSPSVDMDKPVSRQHERDYYRYYGYPYYWGSTGMWGMGFNPGLLQEAGWTETPSERSETAGGDVHLRSAAEVRGYHIQGSDEAIGHVADFIVDEETWEVRYLAVDTSSWWFGKQVLVAPQSATHISWADRTVYVDVSRDGIKNGPEWNATDATEDVAHATVPNPPRTTSFGWLTTPKFGSAGSGGAELDPGPERD